MFGVKAVTGLSFIFLFSIRPVLSQEQDCYSLKVTDFRDLNIFKLCSQKASTDLKVRRELIRLIFKNPTLVSNDQKYTRFESEKIFREELLRLNRIKDIKSDDIQYAKLMIKFIAEHKFQNLFYALIGFLGNPVGELRDAAGKGIAILDDDRIYPILANMLGSTDSLERTYAVNTIYHLKDERTFDFLRGAIEDAEESIRYHAIESLLELNDPQSVKIFIDLLENDPVVEVRRKSAQALGEIRSGSGYKALTGALADSSRSLRSQVIQSMARYKKVRSAAVFSRRLPEEESAKLKIEMIKHMLLLNNAGGGKGLYFLLKEEKNIEVLQWSIYAVGRLRLRGSVKELLNITRHKHAGIRSEAAMALKQLKSTGSVNSLLDLLENEQEIYQVRYSALLAIAAINEPGAYPVLLDISIRTQNEFLKVKIQAVFQQLLNNRYGRRLNR